MAKLQREQAIRERRALKQEKKAAARRAKADGNVPDAPSGDQGAPDDDGR
jgi:hypothetical protein